MSNGSPDAPTPTSTPYAPPASPTRMPENDPEVEVEEQEDVKPSFDHWVNFAAQLNQNALNWTDLAKGDFAHRPYDRDEVESWLNAVVSQKWPTATPAQSRELQYYILESIGIYYKEEATGFYETRVLNEITDDSYDRDKFIEDMGPKIISDLEGVILDMQGDISVFPNEATTKRQKQAFYQAMADSGYITSEMRDALAHPFFQKALAEGGGSQFQEGLIRGPMVMGGDISRRFWLPDSQTFVTAKELIETVENLTANWERFQTSITGSVLGRKDQNFRVAANTWLKDQQTLHEVDPFDPSIVIRPIQYEIERTARRQVAIDKATEDITSLVTDTGQTNDANINAFIERMLRLNSATSDHIAGEFAAHEDEAMSRLRADIWTEIERAVAQNFRAGPGEIAQMIFGILQTNLSSEAINSRRSAAISQGQQIKAVESLNQLKAISPARIKQVLRVLGVPVTDADLENIQAALQRKAYLRTGFSSEEIFSLQQGDIDDVIAATIEEIGIPGLVESFESQQRRELVGDEKGLSQLLGQLGVDVGAGGQEYQDYVLEEAQKVLDQGSRADPEFDPADILSRVIQAQPQIYGPEAYQRFDPLGPVPDMQKLFGPILRQQQPIFPEGFSPGAYPSAPVPMGEPPVDQPPGLGSPDQTSLQMPFLPPGAGGQQGTGVPWQGQAYPDVPQSLTYGAVRGPQPAGRVGDVGTPPPAIGKDLYTERTRVPLPVPQAVGEEPGDLTPLEIIQAASTVAGDRPELMDFLLSSGEGTPNRLPGLLEGFRQAQQEEIDARLGTAIYGHDDIVEPGQQYVEDSEGNLVAAPETGIKYTRDSEGNLVPVTGTVEETFEGGPPAKPGLGGLSEELFQLINKQAGTLVTDPFPDSPTYGEEVIQPGVSKDAFINIAKQEVLAKPQIKFLDFLKDQVGEEHKVLDTLRRPRKKGRGRNVVVRRI
jgi:hypothetical protein